MIDIRLFIKDILFLTFKTNLMKLPKEIYNGLIIFIGIGVYFLVMEILGLAGSTYLRLFNVLFVFYGTNRTLKSNFDEGKVVFVSNAVSALITSFVGVFLSILGLVAYSYAMGGDSYVGSLSKTFLFGGNPSVMTYCISLFFEGIVSAILVTFILMLYWDTRFASDKHEA